MTAAHNLLIASACALCTAATPVRAQTPARASDSEIVTVSSAHEREAWIASSALLAAALVFDERLRSAALANHSRTLDRLSSGADVLGTAGHIVPALVATYVAARLFKRHSFAAATLRVGLSYAAADALESLLKPAVGRIRPDVGREPLTFRPFSAGGDYQSFPSAHVVHISSLSSAIALETNKPWMTALAGIAITYVGAQRVYRDQHWTSDVVASGMLGVEIARLTMHWMRERHFLAPHRSGSL
jgi:membrane-associated phospholipid phosphatase